jgi:hypothetical protein
MSKASAQQLAKRLESLEFRIRTGILEIAPQAFGSEDELAVRLGAVCLDMPKWELERLSGAQRFFRLSAGDLADHVSKAVNELPAGKSSVLVTGFDLLVARLDSAQRAVLWQFLRETLKLPRGVILVLPLGATNLLVESEREKWVADWRLAIWEGAADDGSNW